MSFVVAIVGRPNVGKSTLFNRLVGRRLALVHKQPGVTRDRREAQATVGGLTFTAIDTAGLEEASPETLEERLYVQTQKAVAESDVALMLIDAHIGVTSVDRHFARVLRRGYTPVVLVAGLGLGDPILLSAEHGEGLANLIEALLPFYERSKTVSERTVLDHGGDSTPTLTIVGRQNVGKSTLVNYLLRDERVVTGPEKGITRDSITVKCNCYDRNIRLIDTAGFQKHVRINNILDNMIKKHTLKIINHSEIVLLLLDPNAMLERQDLLIARTILKEGRALVLAVNKWDTVRDSAVAKETKERLQTRLVHALPQAWGLRATFLSAQTGDGVEQLLQTVFNTAVLWNRRIRTANLNRWLFATVKRHPPPIGKHGRRLQLRYLTQSSTRPPTFVLFSSRPEDLPDSYLRYLINDLRQTFELPGVPVRLYTRRNGASYTPHMQS